MTKLPALALSALLFSATPALAQSFTPSSGPATGAGTLHVTSPLGSNYCATSLSGNILTSSTAEFTSVKFSGGINCASTSNLKWTVKTIPGNSSYVKVNIHMFTTSGSCRGDVVVQMSSGTLRLFNETVPAAFPSTIPCKLDGNLNLNFSI